MGIVKPKSNLLMTSDIEHGDVIVLFYSSGIHANGLTLARKIADKLPKGYLTELEDGRTYGETLLDPTHIYVGLIEDCLDMEVDIHYAVNITGHGWRKLMRATQPFAYVLESIPNPPPIFRFLQEHGPIDEVEAYGNLNMGAGFAMYVPEDDVNIVLDAADSLGIKAIRAGYIEKSDTKKVVIMPNGIEYSGETLGVR
jgi:phosphoribosylformylglycinamidine cyclo-ligase